MSNTEQDFISILRNAVHPQISQTQLVVDDWGDVFSVVSIRVEIFAYIQTVVAMAIVALVLVIPAYVVRRWFGFLLKFPEKTQSKQ